MTTCPSCGIAGNNFSCPNHTYWGINPLPDSIPMPTQSAWASLYAEIGRLNVLLNERDKELKEIKECLRWYVENDDTNEGGKWEESNAGWLEGKRRAMRALGMEEE